jgi:hypothetical protein
MIQSAHLTTSRLCSMTSAVRSPNREVMLRSNVRVVRRAPGCSAACYAAGMLGFRFMMGWVVSLATVACGPATGGGDEGSSTSPDATGDDGDDDDDASASSVSASTGEDDDDDTATTGVTLDGGSDDIVGDCELAPLDEAELEQAVLDAGFLGKVPAGGQRQITLAVPQPGWLEPIEACTVWSVSGDPGATIDDTGLLTIAETVEPGTIVTVQANVEDGRRILETMVTVYVPIDSPIVGYWREVEQISCASGDPVEAVPAIEELIFRDTGDFSVTWLPFETYVDYWGTWTHDPRTGALDLAVTGGNYVPEDLDGTGIASVNDARLFLEEMWLGRSNDGPHPVMCGQIFE